MKHGQGMFIYPDGSRYEGSWVANMREGFGKYVYANGDTYEGEWERDLKHGLGAYAHKREHYKYVGQWLYGQMCGEGELVNDSYKLKSKFSQNNPVGSCHYIFHNNNVLDGFYKDENRVCFINFINFLYRIYCN